MHVLIHLLILIAVAVYVYVVNRCDYVATSYASSSIYAYMFED